MSRTSSVKSDFDSMPSSGPSDSQSSSTGVADEEEEEERGHDEVEDSDAEDREDQNQANIVWTGYGKRIPVVIFRADNIITKSPEARSIGEKYHLAFKLIKTECKLLRSVLSAHGFHEAHPNSNDFNLMWTGSHLKPYVLRGLQEFQKVNHFPRSYEITRKDRLFKNIQRLQQTKGFKSFDFLPQSYVVPGEFQEFCSGFLKDKGPWIVKPIASSRGRGIFLVNHPEQVPLDETMIVSKYINNPLLIDGFKFDIRLYVAVTSYDPLIIYLYEEGLTRFATVKFERNAKSIRNQCMHLTNYSVNKKSNNYVSNDDADVEDYGNKWSLGAMLRYLRSMGKDTTAVMMRIEDVIIKTLIAAEVPVATACKMFMPYRGNCFELYGFDVMIDENLRPWVLEVNLSPSLNCDAPIDLKIKSNMMADLFSLIGFVCQDPMIRKVHQGKRNQDINGRPISRAQGTRNRPHSASSNKARTAPVSNMSGLTGEEIRVVRRAKEENARRGGWIRIFPSPDSWELYGSFLQYSTSHNLMLYQQLYPDRAKTVSTKTTTASYSSSLARTKNLHMNAGTATHNSSQSDEVLTLAVQRSVRYERKLNSLGSRKKSRPGSKTKTVSDGAPRANGTYRGTLVQGIPEDISPKQPENTTQSKPHQGRQSGVTASQNHDHSTHHSKPNPIPPREAVQNGKEAHKHTAPYNVVALLEKGHTISKVQARFAFATYLTRVQQRLLTETSGPDDEDADSANEQMDLVLRFLKRAAGNLQQPFKVVVPSRKLMLNDRRRILAKQLGDFVHIYNKETDTLRQRTNLERKHIKRPPSFSQNDGLDEEKFNRYVHTASENALEDVLTTYTKLNKSAAIFLGSKSSALSNHSNTLSGSDPSLVKRKESTTSSHHRGHDETAAVPVTSHELISATAPHPSSLAANNQHNSYAKSVTVYSSRFGGLGVMGGILRGRPSSASNANNRAQGGVRSRPRSASASRPPAPPDNPPRERTDNTDGGGDHYDEEVINTALQRLNIRQQMRQYNATLGRSADLLDFQPDADKDQSKPPKEEAVNRGAAQGSNQPYQNANETFNSFVENALTDGQLGDAYPPAQNNTQYHMAQLSRQQRMQIQSRALLEHSKAKHQAMVAQAHAATGGKSTPHLVATSPVHPVTPPAVDEFAPKPPHKPQSERKPTSAHRLARTAMLDDPGGGTSTFYNSLKYDHHTGTSKPVYSSSYNTGV